MKFQLRIIASLIFIVGLNNFLQAQRAAEDSAKFEATFDWLERKLTYNYYDKTNRHWWVNRIQQNPDGSVTIKNISAKHPDKILEKIYHLRRFYLYEINPNTVSVLELKQDQGRFVKGHIVRAENFSGQKKVQNVKDGTRGSDVSYIHISIPQFLEDSVQGYAEEVKKKLATAARLNARLYNVGHLEDNTTAAFKAFKGSFEQEGGEGTLAFEQLNVGLVRYTWSDANRNFYGTIGFDVNRKVVFFFRASTKAYTLLNLRFDKKTRELILRDGKDYIHVIGRNEIEFFIDGKKWHFFRT